MTPMMTLAEAHAMLPGSTLVGEGALSVTRVHTDTRTLQSGDLFLALKGDNFDAHDFLPQAKAAGAVAAIAERGIAEAGLAGLLVGNTRQALATLATAWRARFDLPMIAVTGSNGKTTVTQMIASILRAWAGDGAFYTQGNFNNDIGVPLTLLRLRHDAEQWHRVGVVELGTNHPGEIAQLAAVAAPTVALVNNAQRDHQEFMQSVEGMARENGAVIEALRASGTAVFPADDIYTPLWRQFAGKRNVLTFALDNAAADVHGRAFWMEDGHRRGEAATDASSTGAMALDLRTPAGDAPVTLRVAGTHNVKNALAATACALAAGCSLDAVVKGLKAFEPVKGRLQLKSFMQGSRRVPLIDDTYNANPDSVRAAIDVLARQNAPQWLVLGDMAEVGEKGVEFHQEVGAYARSRGIPTLWTAGTLSVHASDAFGTGSRHFETVPDLIAALHEGPNCGALLVKGSRFMKMERVVDALMSSAAAPTGGPTHAA